MKEVRFLKSVSSVRGAYRKGDTKMISAKEADHWIAAGYCEEVNTLKPDRKPKAKS